MRLLPLVSELKLIDKFGRQQRFGDVMNWAQRDLILDSERQLRETNQIRTIILKGRQMGLSTAVEGILFAMTFIDERFESLIMSHESDSSERILRMTRNYWETFPFRNHFSTRYAGMKTMEWTFGGRIAVETAGGRDPGRSMTLRGLHGSEVAFWPDPDTLWTGLRNAIPTLEGAVTAIFLESTANGVGNFFHRTWNDAVAGRSEYVPKFYPWWKHPEYTAARLPRHLATQYMRSMKLDEEERTLVQRYGITLEQLAWRRWAIINVCTGKDATGRALSVSGLDQFHAEFPSEPNEAFLSTGRNVFQLKSLLKHYNPWKGDVGRLTQGRGSKVRFEKHEQGELTIYRPPSTDRNWGIYRIGADPAHTVSGDWACAQVIHRRTMEQVAVLRVKADPYRFAELLHQLGTYYNNATIACEREGPGLATIGQLNGLRYPAIWQSTNVASAGGHITDSLGWSTNEASKHQAIQALVRLLNEPLARNDEHVVGLQIHDQWTLTELRDYRLKDDGRGYENGDGSPHDDGVMALAIAAVTHLIDIDEIAPYEPDEQDTHVQRALAQRAAHEGAPVVPAVRRLPTDGVPVHSFDDPITPVPSDERANEYDQELEELREDFGI